MPRQYTVTVQDSDNPELSLTRETINVPRFKRNTRKIIQRAQGRRSGLVLPGYEIFANTKQVDFIVQHRVQV